MSSPTAKLKSKLVIAPWLVFVIVLGTILSTRAAAAQKGAIDLTVTDSAGNPVDDATVKVAGLTGLTGSKSITHFELAPGR